MTPTEVTGGEVSCSPGHEQTDDCCCFSTEPVENGDGFGNGEDRPVDACPAVVLCAPLTIQCDHNDPDCPINTLDYGSPSPISVDDEEALACVLTMLRDSTPGLVTWTIDWGFSTVERFYIHEDRSVFTYRVDMDEGGILYGDVTRQTIAAAGKVDLCLMEPDLRDRVGCLKKVTTGPVVAMCT